MTKRLASDSSRPEVAGGRRSSPFASLIRIATATATALLIGGAATLIGATAASAQPTSPFSVTGNLNGAPAPGSILIADQNGVYSMQPDTSSALAVGDQTADPYGVAVDSSGDVFIANEGASNLEEVSALGGGDNIIESGFSYLLGVAVDPDGDVFAGDYFNGLYEFPANQNDPETNLGGVEAWGVATDAAGDVYFADQSTNAIEEIPAGGSWSSFTTIATFPAGSQYAPTGLALDGSGNLLVTLPGASEVVEIPEGSSNLTVNPATMDVIATNVTADGVSIDDASDVILPDYTDGNVYEVPESGDTAVSDSDIVAYGFDSPQAVAAVPPVVYTPAGSSIPTQIVVPVSASGTFGATNATIATVEGTPSGVSPTIAAAVLSGSPICSVQGYNTTAIPVASPPLDLTSCTGLSITSQYASQYTLAYDYGPVTITAIPLTVAPSPRALTETYGTPVYYSSALQGAPAPTFTPSMPQLLADDATGSTANVTCAPVGTTAKYPPAGQYTTSCSGVTGDSYYPVTYATGTLTVSKANLTISSPSETINYGTAPPTTEPATGFVNGDTAASIGLSVSCSTAATATSAPGNYSITCTPSPASFTNYTVSPVTGSITIVAAPLVVTASNTTSVYGATPQVPTASYSVAAVTSNPSVLGTVTCKTTVTSTSPVGSYGGANSCSGASDANYAITYATGTAVITQAATLQITPTSVTITYGQALPSIAPVYSVSGVSIPSVTCSANIPGGAVSTAGWVSAGTYTTTCSVPAGFVNTTNYAITSSSFMTGTLTVNRAPVVVTAPSASMVYGSSPPVFGYAAPALVPTYSGLASGEVPPPGDVPSAFTSQATCSTAATSASSVAGGPYATTCSGAVDPNYTFTYTAGKLTVSTASLTITASNITSIYGSTPSAPVPTFSAFAGNDTSSSLSTQPTCTDSVTVTSAVAGSPYTTTCSGAVDSNYTINYVAGDATVTPATITVTASSLTIALGAKTPTITATYSGFVNGQTASVISGSPVCTTVAGALSVLGVYLSTCTVGTLSAANYIFSFASGQVTVASGALTVTAVSTTALFGQPLPILIATISGFPSGVTLANSGITGTPACTTTAVVGSPAGTYPITCTAGTLKSSSYSFTFVPGVLTVGYSSACVSGTVKVSYTVPTGKSICFGPTAVIDGAVNVSLGASLDVEGAKISGPLTTLGSDTLRICSASISGAVTVIGDSQAALIGNGTSSCGASAISGPLTFTLDYGGISVQSAAVSGPLTVLACGGGVLLSSNTISGSTSVSLSSGGVTVESNKISGSLTVILDSGTTTVSSNKVSGATTL